MATTQSAPHQVTFHSIPEGDHPDEREITTVITHPEGCSGHPDECAFTDHVHMCGLADDTFMRPFTSRLPHNPHPLELTEADYETLEGTTLHFVAVVNSRGPSAPDWEWDVEVDFNEIGDHDATYRELQALKSAFASNLTEPLSGWSSTKHAFQYAYQDRLHVFTCRCGEWTHEHSGWGGFVDVAASTLVTWEGHVRDALTSPFRIGSV